MADSLECDVAIVGAGPAGLGAAIALRQAGVARVLVLERESQAGGVPRHCGHPPFGMSEFGWVMTGPAYARRLAARALQAGVDIRTNHSVMHLGSGGRLDVAAPGSPLSVSARRVIVATGARESPRSARLIGGERPVGVINTGALQSFIYLERKKPFLRPVIVGTELVSLSAVWTCLAHGIRPVAVIERGKRGTARWPLALFPRIFGIPVHYESELSFIGGKDRVSEVFIAGPDGAERSIACDGVLLTGLFRPESSLAQASGLSIDDGSHGPAVDQFGRCSDPAYFATGNVLRGIETAGWCHREGLRTGRLIAASLDRAEPPARTINVHRGKGIALALPQRLSMTGSFEGASPMQVRLTAPHKGRLRVMDGDRELWSRAINSRQERRLLIPLDKLNLDPEGQAITVSL